MTAARPTVSLPLRTARPAASRAAPAADAAGARAEPSRGEASRPEPLRAKTPHRLRRIAEKRTAILDAALSLFSRNGLHGTTVEQIARTAAVSKTNLFYYFASKEEVYVGVLSRLLDQWLDPLRALEVETDPVEGIRAYISRKIRFSRTHPEASRLFCLEVVQGAPLLRPELETALKQLVDAKTEVIAGWIAAGKLAPVDPHHLIFALWATTQHYADFAPQIDALLGRGLDEEAFVEEATRNVQRLILDGLRPR
ncbi:HTH-type transcriptional regulator RutR [Ancylobacter rudongensis]|uniref:Transcriptional regulator, TetR family n=1 Tax=Ancylobacter rudongensis TaxID=177413 RepID=A0A1G4UKB4_9HYPH|nr:HTH-type transcriptional regulator RutR [Ancylobacter rudongensis]SCW94088.1 transcriptional regulator, TetR family [Ancylobacter rudongensis]